MRWRDIRFEKPTKADGDEYGKILQRLTDGIVVREPWGDLTVVVAWMPLSELPQPDLPGPIPNGWRPVDQAVDVFDDRASFWGNKSWNATFSKVGWDKGLYYIVPIDPPKSQYRPFAGVTEFMPHAGRLWRYKDNANVMSPSPFSGTTHYGDTWEFSLIRKEFVEMLGNEIVASPFGVKVE
jgi:hypothetical protein